MKLRTTAIGLLLFFLGGFFAYAAAPGILNKTTPDGKPHIFSFGGKDGESFLLDGKAIQIRSGEIHPQRIPKKYWRNRIQMTKAMGMNTIAFYIMWNGFEQPDGSFDFKSGNRDIAEFMKICQEEGMWVLFRPGPYVCGEWDFGGIPPQLLKYPDLKIRTLADARFMAAQTKYLEALAPIAKPFLSKNGGPILMTQLENEYGSYPRKSRSYMQWLKDFWTKKGFGPFYSSDGAGKKYLEKVVLPGVAVGLDPGKSEKAWEVARKYNPGVPIFSSETYPGWLRHWGDGNWRPTNLSKAITWYMETGKSFNIFVIHGGSNFGFTAGANNGGRGGYRPDLTSYDYGSPINEQGHPTKEYHQYRKIIEAALKENGSLADIPEPPPAMEIPDFTPKRFSGLWDLFPKPKPVPFDQMWFEAWGQNQGLAVYSTMLPAGDATTFTYQNLNDYGLIFLDGKLIKTVNRQKGGKRGVEIPKRKKPTRLDILVEGMGHINFSGAMEHDRKGLFGKLKLGKTLLKKWTVSPLPLTDESIVNAKKPTRFSTRPGSHFRARLILNETPVDTFLDMSKYKKGVVWVNGHNLGRYWNMGPQLRLYCPAPWLKKGENIIDIIDLEMEKPRPIRGCKTRNYDMKNKKTQNTDNVW